MKKHDNFMKNKLIVSYGSDMRRITREMLDESGLKDNIPVGAKIGIKPNLVVARPASEGATTHPEIVEELIDYLLENGHDNIIILEGSWVGDSTKRAFKVCGYEDISEKYDIPLIDTKSDEVESMIIDGITMDICREVLNVDFLINMPVLKGHCQTKITGAMKNLKGIISDSEKRHFHQLGLHDPIALLNEVVKSSFILVDGICGDLDFEEGGNPITMNRVICGTDPVLMDSFIAETMGYEPGEVEYIRIGKDLGRGSMDVEKAEIIELGKDESIRVASPSRIVQTLSRYIGEREACSACYANLTQALKRLSDQGEIQKLEEGQVKIGQGFKNKSSFDGRDIGIGLCTKNMEDSLVGCPPKTMDILKHIKEKL